MNIVVEGGEVFVLLEGHRVPCELNGVSSELSDGVYELRGVAPISAENHDSPKTFNINFNMSFGSLVPKSDYGPCTDRSPPIPSSSIQLFDPRRKSFTVPAPSHCFDSIEEQIKENPEFEAMIRDLIESIKADHFNYLKSLPKGVQVSVEELTEKYNGHQLPHPPSKFTVNTLAEVIRNQKDPS